MSSGNVPDFEQIGLAHGVTLGTEALMDCRCARQLQGEKMGKGMGQDSPVRVPCLAVGDLTGLALLLVRWRALGKTSSSSGHEVSQEWLLALI